MYGCTFLGRIRIEDGGEISVERTFMSYLFNRLVKLSTRMGDGEVLREPAEIFRFQTVGLQRPEELANH